MAEIINILNTILRILQTLIILGSIAIFIYLGILFYLKKFDEVKKNLPYVVLGLALLISVYSIPVIILSFLERSPTGLDLISRDMMGNTNTTTNNVNCQITFIDYDEHFTILGNSSLGFDNPSVISQNNSCIITMTLVTQPQMAYVLCQYGNDGREQNNCWGIYKDGYPNGFERRLNFSGFEPLNNLNPTKRLKRFPEQHNTFYCTSTEIAERISVPASDKRYIFVIFSAEPSAINLCSDATSSIIKLDMDLPWIRKGADMFDLITTSSR